MNTKKLQRFTLFILLFGLFCAAPALSEARAETTFSVTDVALKADVNKQIGRCPILVKFSGYVTVNGPGEVKYTFTRSDGATGPVHTLTFEEAGTKAVSTDWTLGGLPALPYYRGWQAVKILSPNEMESSHETGGFAISCEDAPRDDFKVTDVFLKADNGNQTGRCPLFVKFNGYITANGPGTIQYTFTRSDGATAPIYTLTFTEAGTKPVSTDWTLGGIPGLPHYEGWQAVKVLSPNEMESSHMTGGFAINCQDTSLPRPTLPPEPPVSPLNRARFRVTINGFRVDHQTRDDLLQRDGRGDEVFFLSQWSITEGRRTVNSSGLLRSRVMGDSNGRSDRVTAGRAEPSFFHPGIAGGLLTGDTFPTYTPQVLSGPPTSDRAPMLLFEGELTSNQILVVVPTIWEQDGPDDLSDYDRPRFQSGSRSRFRIEYHYIQGWRPA